jgi:hypothetical protein
MRSLKDSYREARTGGCDGTPSLGTTGISMLGGGGDAGSGGLNCDQPGGVIRWPTAAPATSVHVTAPIQIDSRFIEPMS